MNETTKTPIEETLTESINNPDSWISEESETEPGDIVMMDVEPDSEIFESASAEEVIETFKKNYNVDISFEDVAILIDIKKNVDDGSITNPYAQLPVSIQKLVKSTINTMGMEVNMGTLNLISSTLMMEIFSSAEIDSCIKEFTETMEEIKNRTTESNIETDARLDAVLEKIKTMYDEREKHDETDPGAAERIETTYNTFIDAVSLKNIIKDITERPSLLNRAYKEIGNFNSYAMDYDSKFCCNTEATSNVKIRTLESIYWGLTYNTFIDEEVAKTICILLARHSSDKNVIDSMYDKWFVYYSGESLATLHQTTLLGDVSSMTTEAVKTVKNMITELKLEKAARKHKGKKRG